MKFIATLTLVLSASSAIAQDPSGDVHDPTSTEEILTPETCAVNHKDDIRHWLDQTNLPRVQRTDVYSFDQIFVFDRAYAERICSCPYSRVSFDEYQSLVLSYGGDSPSASIEDFLNQSLSLIGVNGNTPSSDKHLAVQEAINNTHQQWLEWRNNDKECLKQLEDGFNSWVEANNYQSLPEEKNLDVYLNQQGGVLIK